MGRVISEFFTDDDRGKAIVKYSPKDETFYIDYYDNKGHKFFSEDFSNHNLAFVENAAEDWTLGIKELV